MFVIGKVSRHVSLFPLLLVFQVVQETRNASMARFFYDLYMYRHFPAYLPTLGALLSFASFFACLQYLGWLWGIVAFGALHTCFFDKMMEATIATRISRINQGSAICLVLALVVNHCVLVQQYSSINMSAAFYLVSLAVFYFMYKCTSTVSRRAPGVHTADRLDVLARIVQSSPSEGPADSEEVLSAISKPPPPQLCAVCLIDKGCNMSKHCPTCDVCMSDKLDHHCSFLNNCVGEGNRRLFVALLFFCTLGSALASVMNYHVAVSVYCHDDEHTNWVSVHRAFCLPTY
jgi:hypothetical protein